MGIKCFGHSMKAKAFIIIRREKYMVFHEPASAMICKYRVGLC